MSRYYSDNIVYNGDKVVPRAVDEGEGEEKRRAEPYLVARGMG